jgi:1,4-dihydroxy-2-naphthoate octaprenyltransferase
MSEMKAGIIIAAILSLICGSLLVREATKDLDISKAIIFMTLGIFSIIAAIKYTVGKNAYGYMGLGDLAVFFFLAL